MSFKELMEKYKSDTASDEERQLVEKELEKYEVIEDYYSQMMGFEIEDSFEKVGDREESLKIKKSVNRKFKRVIFATLAIILGLLVTVFFVVSPLVDSMYYNPRGVTVGESEADIFFDLEVIMELNMPGHDLFSLVDVDSRGFGNYDINFSRINLFNDETTNVITKLEKNEQFNMRISYYENRYNAFKSVRMPDFFDEEVVEKDNDMVLNHLNQLSPVSYISSYLTFDNDLTMEELHQLDEANPDITFAWVAVRTPESEEVFNMLGFAPMFGITIAIDDSHDLEKYPALDIHDFIVNPGIFDDGSTSIRPVAYERHYLDLLQYVVDREDAIGALELNQLKHDFYKEALEYSHENGVRSYGVLAYADAGDLIEFVENGPIYHIELDDILVSRKDLN